MLLKTKERCEKGGAEAGMLLITKGILSGSGNLIENKGESNNLVYPSLMPLREYCPLVGRQSASHVAKSEDFWLARYARTG
jgi:hypothetical protein